MRPQDKLRKIQDVFGQAIPPYLRFILGRKFGGVLRPIDYRVIREWFYREKGIYEGEVTVEEDLLAEPTSSNETLLTRRHILVMRKAVRLIPAVVIDSEIAYLIRAEDPSSDPKRLIEFPLPERLDEEDKTPTD